MKAPHQSVGEQSFLVEPSPGAVAPASKHRFAKPVIRRGSAKQTEWSRRFFGFPVARDTQDGVGKISVSQPCDQQGFGAVVCEAPA